MKRISMGAGTILNRFSFSILVLLLFHILTATAFGAQKAPALSQAEKLRLGEQMYLTGMLPSGKPMQAYVSGDVPVEGSSFTCVSCHLRSGIGSFEANVATPPTNGRILYQPRKVYIEGFEHVPSYHKYASYFPERPAYTDETLAELLTTGTDPTDRSVLKVMPRYDLNDEELEMLIAYLKTLSDKLSPGVSDKEIKFATVIGPDVDPQDVEAMTIPIEFTIGRKNAQVLAYENHPRMARMAYNMMGPELSSRTFSLARWTLKGEPDTWRAQLEQYYRDEPVFALLGGISNSVWEPVHRFCEDNRIPDILPITDFPVLSDTDWYTLYATRGARQEGEAAARYLNTMHELFAGRPIVQVIGQSRKARAMAEGFRQVWREKGRPAPVDVLVNGKEKSLEGIMNETIAEHKPAVLLVWDDALTAETFKGLENRQDRPGIVLASGAMFGKQLFSLPESLRSIISFTYPYRLPQEEKRYDPAVHSVMVGKNVDDYDSRILRQSYIVEELLGMALVKMRGEFYRDFFLDTIGMMADATFPLYERISFGPGQRYLSKGCYIVQLSKGDTPVLERKSSWFVQ